MLYAFSFLIFNLNSYSYSYSTPTSLPPQRDGQGDNKVSQGKDGLTYYYRLHPLFLNNNNITPHTLLL